MKQDSITIHDQYATQYDASVIEYGSHIAEILFGLTYDFVKPQDSLLDVGIGTGLGSEPFAKAGLVISGIDGSAAMLEICRAKGFAKVLKQYDLQATPWPYADSSFNHVLACGLFHFFGDLAPMAAEVNRLVKPGGIFALTFMSDFGEMSAEDQRRGYSEFISGENTGYRHSPDYIDTLLDDNGLKRLKLSKTLIWSGQGDKDNLFYACVAQKVR